MGQIGVLALQGGFDAHLRALRRIGVPNVPVKSIEEMREVDALIIPGGESTTIGKLLVQHGILENLRALIANGLPVFGTCAGMILLAREVKLYSQPLLGVLDICVERNAYGRQTSSFETQLEFQNSKVPAIFIRAPKVRAAGPDVVTLIEYEGSPVLLQQGRLLAASFHPELSDSTAIHEYFIDMAGI